MKALLDYYGFTKEIEIPEPRPRLYVAVFEKTLNYLKQLRLDPRMLVTPVDFKKLEFEYVGVRSIPRGPDGLIEPIAHYRYRG